MHDKVEFEIARPNATFLLKDELCEYQELLSVSEFEEWFERLNELTEKLIEGRSKGSIKKALGKLDRVDSIILKYNEKLSHPIAQIERIKTIMDFMTRNGSRPFCILARHGFIAESLIRSIVYKKIITQKRISEFKESISTVADMFSRDTDLLLSEKNGLE